MSRLRFITSISHYVVFNYASFLSSISFGASSSTSSLNLLRTSAAWNIDQIYIINLHIRFFFFLKKNLCLNDGGENKSIKIKLESRGSILPGVVVEIFLK